MASIVHLTPSLVTVHLLRPPPPSSICAFSFIPSAAPRVPRILLPRKKAREPLVSLVLDLDETLVHCSVEPIADADVTFPVTFAGTSYQVRCA